MKLVAGAFFMSVILLAVAGCSGNQSGNSEPGPEAGTASLSLTSPSQKAMSRTSRSAMSAEYQRIYRNTPKGVRGKPFVASLSRNGTVLAVGYTGGYVAAWNIENEKNPILVMRSSMASQPESLAVSDDGSMLALAYFDVSALSVQAKVSIWKISPLRHLADFAVDDALTLEFNRAGTRLITAGAGLHVFNISTKQLTTTRLPLCDGDESPVDAAAFASDDSSVVALLDSCFFVWHPGKAIGHISETGEENGYAVSPDGTEVAASTGDEVSVWDVETGRQISGVRATPPMGEVQTAAFLGGNERLAVGGSTTAKGPSFGARMIEVFDVAQQAKVAQDVGAGNGAVGIISYSPYGVILALTRGENGNALDAFPTPVA